jgi:hypothetical protein
LNGLEVIIIRHDFPVSIQVVHVHESYILAEINWPSRSK